MTPDLRTERQRRGWRLEDVAESTKIPLRYLAALEDDDMVVLPPGPFRRGYLRQYLDQLGISADTLPTPIAPEDPALDDRVGAAITLGDDDGLQAIEHTSTTATIPRVDEIPVIRLVITGFVLTLAVVLGLRLGSQFLDSAPSATETTPVATLPTQTLRVRATEPTRVRMIVDGQVQEQTIIRPGEPVELVGTQRIELDADDLTTLFVQHNDDHIEPLHTVSHARRLVFLQDPTE